MEPSLPFAGLTQRLPPASVKTTVHCQWHCAHMLAHGICAVNLPAWLRLLSLLVHAAAISRRFVDDTNVYRVTIHKTFEGNL
jgi:hypothetical protein